MVVQEYKEYCFSGTIAARALICWLICTFTQSIWKVLVREFGWI